MTELPWPVIVVAAAAAAAVGIGLGVGSQSEYYIEAIAARQTIPELKMELVKAQTELEMYKILQKIKP